MSRVRSPINLMLLALGLSLAMPGQAEETRRIEGLSFDEVMVLGDVKVEISQGDQFEVQLRGEEVLLDRGPFYVSRDTLVLGAGSRTASATDSDDGDLRFRVVMPSLRQLKLKGSGHVYLRPFLLTGGAGRDVPVISLEGSGELNLYDVKGPALELRIKGSGRIKAAKLDIEDLEVVVAGSGDIYVQTLQAKQGEFVVTGSGDLNVSEKSFVQTMEVNVVGSGDADMAGVGSQRTEASIVGSGSISIGEVIEQLNALVLGSGDLVYAGTPEVESVQLGSGEVRRRD